MNSNVPPPLSVPPPQPKRSGWACLGTGCAILLVLLLLFCGLIGGGIYYCYKIFQSVTTTEALPVATFDGGDDMYQAVLKKLDQLNTSINQNASNSISLSADEINTLLSHRLNTSLTKTGIFVVMEDNHIKMQFSLPLKVLMPQLGDRYINGDLEFIPNGSPGFINLTFSKLTLNHQVVPEKFLSNISQNFSTSLTSALEGNPDTKNIVDHLKSLRVENNQLIVEVE